MLLLDTDATCYDVAAARCPLTRCAPALVSGKPLDHPGHSCLREAVERRPIVGIGIEHALTLKTFYHYGSDSCLELDLKSVSFGAQALGLNDSALAEAIRARHERWAKALPKESADLWDALQAWDGDSQAMLFAHGNKGTHIGMIVPGTIVPIRASLCYSYRLARPWCAASGERRDAICASRHNSSVTISQLAKFWSLDEF